MKLKQPKNENYAGIVVEIKTTVPLAGCNNVQAAIIMGNQVIVSKDTKVGDIGIYFPLECQLSKEYLSNNNLYRKKLNLNIDPEDKGGFFEENGRIRCQKFMGYKSEGLYMPLESLQFAGKLHFEIGDVFDELNGVEICRKYVTKKKVNSHRNTTEKSSSRIKRESRLVDGQFRFHDNTSMLYRNLHRIEPDTIISITYKLHGTSGISSYVLCNRKLKLHEKIAKFLGVKVVEQEYDYIYSSRKVIKNEYLNPNAKHYYSEDIWGMAHKKIESLLLKGMTIYYEIVGYLPGGGEIQKGYDYGCKDNEFSIFVYRITHTNSDGKVIEYSAKQVQEYCKKFGLNPVPELFYGRAEDLYNTLIYSEKRQTDALWNAEKFLEVIKLKYNDHNCYICYNEVPEEGVVIRVEGLDFEAYKQKSNLFYELETKLLDKGEIDIEEEN